MNSFCVFSAGRNYFARQTHREFFKSMSLQNYTNFKIIYVDNNSDDNSTEKMYAYLNKNFANLRGKVTFIKNRKEIGDLMVFDSGVKENCEEKDIVIDLTSDGSLVGKQTLNIINAVFEDNPSIWALKTDYF